MTTFPLDDVMLEEEPLNVVKTVTTLAEADDEDVLDGNPLEVVATVTALEDADPLIVVVTVTTLGTTTEL